MNKRILVILLPFIMGACNSKVQEPLSASYLHDWNVAFEQGLINDFFSPPVAGRMYTYPNLAVYAIRTNGKGKLLNNLKDFPTIEYNAENKEIVGLYAFYYVGKKMIYSYNFLEDHLGQFEKKLKEDGYTQTELNQAQKNAEEISKKIIVWAQQDHYKETRSATQFTLSKKPGSWKPTPPDFLDGLEPSWSKIRPFFIDSASQFTSPYKPYPYNVTDKTSDFYKELQEVKEQVDKTNHSELATSKYWDCNPLAPQHVSHITYAEKKLTPGGHWISILRNVSKSKKESFEKACEAYALISLSIHDGFIACWQAKYHYDYIRPVTAIQENWDSKWNTLILTPNFPEYPSGHSVISGVASTLLAHHYGDKTVFTDNAEEPFGMAPRKFKSFTEACDQAAMSRFYAGIHFKKSILDGVDMGREIGRYIIEKVVANESKH